MDVVPGSLVVGFCHQNDVKTQFHGTLMSAVKVSERFIAEIASQAARQEMARNDIVNRFLEGPGEWLLEIDPDMVLEDIYSLDKIVDAAIEADSRVAAGLCFVYDPNQPAVLPNIFMWNEGEKRYEIQPEYQRDQRFWVDATGSAFLLIHRSVLEALYEDHGPYIHRSWYPHPDTGLPMGHDIALCRDIRELTGEPVLYCADIKLGHIKQFVVDEATFERFLGSG